VCVAHESTTRAASDPGIDMLKTCEHAVNMSKMIQIRNVPDDLHRELKSRAALAGMTLSDYLTQQLRKVVHKPSKAEWFRELRKREPVKLEPSAAEIIRELRGPLP
jgi:plasmid stability protein